MFKGECSVSKRSQSNPTFERLSVISGCPMPTQVPIEVSPRFNFVFTGFLKRDNPYVPTYDS